MELLTCDLLLKIIDELIIAENRYNVECTTVASRRDFYGNEIVFNLRQVCRKWKVIFTQDRLWSNLMPPPITDRWWHWHILDGRIVLPKAFEDRRPPLFERVAMTQIQKMLTELREEHRHRDRRNPTVLTFNGEKLDVPTMRYDYFERNMGRSGSKRRRWPLKRLDACLKAAVVMRDAYANTGKLYVEKEKKRKRED